MKRKHILWPFIFIVLLLTGCTQTTPDLNILFCGGALDAEQTISCGIQLAQHIHADNPSVSYLLTGSGKTQDARLQDTFGQSQFAAMITAREVDIVICALEDDDMLAKNESFMALDQIFSEAEQLALQDRLITYPSDPLAYGIDITGHTAVQSVFGNSPVGIFLADNCPNPELAKGLIRQLVLS